MVGEALRAEFGSSLSEEELLERAAADDPAPEMSVASVLDAAMSRTRLTDFGEEGFEERLGHLLSEVQGDENLWNASKAGFVGHCVSAASKRLLNQAFLTANPDVHDIVIDRPLIVVGLSRSGTTHLQNLISADRRLRYLPVYLGSEPVPTPGEDQENFSTHDPRWVRANERWKKYLADPVLSAMHDISPDHACGDNELQIPDFASCAWEAFAFIPSWRERYLATDQSPHYLYAKTILKAVSFQFRDDRRWVLKGTQNCEQLPTLSRTYPDSIMIMTHRDPLAVLRSVLTMQCLRLLSLQRRPNLPMYVEYWVERVESMLRAYMRDMAGIPSDRRADVIFADFMADEMGTALRILDKAGLPPTPAAKDDLRSYLERHRRWRRGRVAYDLGRDFGVSITALRSRFRFYTDYFGVPDEVS